MQCPECGSQDLYFFHDYKFYTIVWLIVCIAISWAFDSLLKFLLPMLRLYFSIPFVVLLFVLFIYFYISDRRHPRLHVICKSCGHDWIAF